MPLPARNWNEGPDFKVLLLDEEGNYLAGDPGHWYFSSNREAAVVLNHRADHVAEQLETLHRTRGIRLKAVPVPLQEIYETCDRCRELFMPVMIFFDGKAFICAECRSRSPRRPRRAS